MGPKSTLRLIRTLGPSLASMAQSLEFEIEFVEPNFGAKISLIMISEF